jgi:hypothetical protein
MIPGAQFGYPLGIHRSLPATLKGKTENTMFTALARYILQKPSSGAINTKLSAPVPPVGM